MSIKPSSRFSASKKDVWSIINETAAAVQAESGKPVINLGQGFFSYQPPDFAIKAAQEALATPGLNQYSPTRGLPVLKSAIAKAYSPLLNWEVNPDTEVVVTAGANEGMYSAFTAFVEEGEEVIVFEPFFDQYISNIELPGGKVTYVPLHPPKDDSERKHSAEEWTIDFSELENAIVPGKTKMIVLNTPHNPVGKVFSKEELLKIGSLAEKYNLIILSDEVYDRLHYGGFTRIATLSEDLKNRTLTVGSAGKTFAATGWRVGWLIGPEHLIKYTAAAHTRICFTVNTPLQKAVSVAFEIAEEKGYYQQQIEAFQTKYKIFLQVFDDLNIPYTVPQGGYFVLVNFKNFQIPEDYVFPEDIVEGRARDFKLAYFFIKEFGVVGIPPTEFYTKANEYIGQDYLRFAVCKDDELLVEAVNKLKECLPKYLKK